MHVHPVVNVSHTQPYFDQPDDIRQSITPPPPPIIGPLGEEFEVESVLKHRQRGKSFQFLVLWKGHPSHDATWEPTEHFRHEDGTYHSSLTDYITLHDLYAEVVIPSRGE